MKKIVLFMLLALGVVICAGEVKVSSFGFDAADSTKFVQAAIDSGAKKVIVDKMSSPWVIGPVMLRSDLELVFAKDVLVEALPDSYKDKFDTMFKGIGVKNVIIRGEPGAHLKMRKKDYQDEKRYTRGEWRHTISILSGTNITIRDLKLSSSGGDGIYIGVDKGNAQNYCKDILVDNVISDDHNRQGMSVISVENLIVRNSTFSNTGGMAPMAGIDFEPNGSGERIVNCLVENCKFINNSGGGVMVAVTTKMPLAVTVKDCYFSGGGRGAIFYFLNKTPGKVYYENCRFENIGRDAFSISNHSINAYEIEFKDCTVMHSAATPTQSPVAFIVNQLGETVFGNVKFANLAVSGYQESPLIALKNWNAEAKLGNVSGSIVNNGVKVDAAEYVKTEKLDTFAPYEMAKCDVHSLTKPSGKRVHAASMPLRQEFELLFYGDAGEEAEFELDYRNLRRKQIENKVVFSGADGKSLELGAVKPGEKKSFTVKFPSEGVWKLSLNVDYNNLVFKPGENLRWAYKNRDSAHGMINLFKTGRNRPGYFEVPRGVKDFKIEVGGDPGETIDLEIRDAQGKVVRELKNFDAPTVFELTRSTEAPEVWSFVLKRTTEDVKVRFHAPLIPVWADSPGNLPRLP